MPDDFFDILEYPNPVVDLLEPTEDSFEECAECKAKPGTPELCLDCLDRRAEFQNTRKTRKPIVRRTTSIGSLLKYPIHTRVRFNCRKVCLESKAVPNRFDRNIEPVEGAPSKAPLPAPRESPPALLSEGARTYLAKKESSRETWERISGALDLNPPSRFEKINWSSE